MRTRRNCGLSIGMLIGDPFPISYLIRFPMFRRPGFRVQFFLSPISMELGYGRGSMIKIKVQTPLSLVGRM